MAVTGVRETYTSTGNPLCDRLKEKFADRGANAVTVKVPSVSKTARRVQKTLDPFEIEGKPASEKRAETQTELQRRQISLAYMSAGRLAVQNPTLHKAETGATTAPANRKVLDAKKAVAPSRSAALPAEKRKTVGGEVRLQRKPFPFAAVMMLTIFTLMVMVIVYSFAQNYELSGEISALERQEKALLEEERALTLQLEERDDIRLIQDIAVNQIGMVKSDLVESRFVTVSGGNRVVVASLEEPTEEKTGIFSTMLSAIGENFSKLWEYID